MPPKHVFQFACPCCDEWIEIDTRSGKARAVDPKSKKGKGADLDKLIDEQAKANEKFDSMFDQAKQDEDRRTQRLDDLLSDAKKRAKDDKSKPRNPFDLE